MGKAWKELEKKTALALGGVRINRADDYGRSDYDVFVPDFDFLRPDCKYRQRHAHHSFIEEVRTKYCSDGGYPVLVTKQAGEHREYVTCDLNLFAALLQLIRNLSQEKKNETDQNQHVPHEGPEPIP